MNIEQLYSIFLRHSNIQTDTRKISEDCLFFALKGPNFNGNTFALEALKLGAAYAIVDEDIDTSNNGQLIRVSNVLQCLQELALYHRKQFKIPFIAITGSNGKTTSKELLNQVLSKKYKTYATKGNLNNHIGVPLTILSIPNDAEMAIIEMGANHIGEIASYCRIALPTHGIITNCGKAHLEGFGSIEGVRKAKGELYDFIRNNDGFVFINTDLSYLAEMATGIKHQVTYGSTHQAQTLIQPLAHELFLKAQVTYQGIVHSISTHLVGDYNLHNIAMAFAVGAYFDIKIPLIVEALESYRPDNSRSQFIKIGINQIILDAYNANPSSMRAAIENFSKLEGKKILCLGAMKEMGPEEASEHRDLVQFIEQKSWYNVILVGKEFEAFKSGYLWFENAVLATQYLKTQLPQEALILIKGSRGSKMEQLLEAFS